MNEKTEIGFEPAFIEMLLEESFLLIIENTEGDIKKLIENVHYLYYANNEISKGTNLEMLDPAGIRERVESITRLIWSLGGTFYNSTGEFLREKAV